MIRELEQIRDVFSMFHDGCITGCVFREDTLKLNVQIEYLASRIAPALTRFDITIYGVNGVRFRPWYDDDHEHGFVTDVAPFLHDGLEILNGDLRGDALVVVCARHDPHSSLRGGELVLKTSGIEVTDELGREVAVETLTQICRDYWEKLRKASSNKGGDNEPSDSC